MAVDLHIHSIYSDGTLTPRRIVQEAIRAELTAIAIADHDTVEGVPLATEAAEGSPLEVIPAVEINVEENGREIHILGFFLDLHSPSLLKAMEVLCQSRVNRMRRFVERLTEAGVHVSLEEVLEYAGPGTVGRPHLAQVLVARGYAGDEREAFRRYLVPGASTYVPRQHIQASQAIEIIRSARGVPVLAHPAKANPPETMKEMVRLGIMGVEVYHPEQPPEQERLLLAFAREHNLLVTGGSDYHGRSMAKDFSFAQRTCPDEHYLRLKSAAESLRPLGPGRGDGGGDDG